MAAAKIIRTFLEGGRGTVEYTGLEETFETIRDQFREFGKEVVEPYAHSWHMDDVLIPDDVVKQMGEMGVFGLTIPEEFGGLGLGKTAMCVVSEELSRAYIGVGSLGTAFRDRGRADLLNGGTRAQQEEMAARHRLRRNPADRRLHRTEHRLGPRQPAHPRRARWRHLEDHRQQDLDHARARADLMTVLARSIPDTNNFSGLSMFICEKPRGTDENPFPANGMTGGEIECSAIAA
jgi:(2S)-methylsuccinyl-CoA dehydrogenase